MLKKLVLFHAALLAFCVQGIAQRDSSMKLDLGISKGQNIYLWPLVRVKKSPEVKSTELFFSMYMNKRNFVGHTMHRHFFPLYYLDSNDRQISRRFGTFYYPSLFRYKHDKEDSSHSYRFMELAPGISLVDVTRSVNGYYFQNNAFFFLWSKRDLINQKAYTVVFPVYWSFTNKDNSVKTLFPLYWNIRDSTHHEQVLIPFWWQNQNPTYSKTTFFPLYAKGSSPDGRKSHRMITPLYWELKDTHYLKKWVIPFYLHQKLDWERTTRKGNYRFQSVSNTYLLLYTERRILSGSDSLHTYTLFPLFRKSVSRSERSTSLFPVYFYKNNKTFRQSLVFPIYYHRLNKADKAYLKAYTPLIWISHNASSNRQVLFPVYWQKEAHKTINGNSYSERSRVLFPIWYSIRKTGPRPEQFHLLFPLYAYKINPGGYRSQTLFPLLSKGSSPNGSFGHFAVTPLFWNLKKPGQRKTVLFPLYWYKKQELGNGKKQIAHTLFPVFFNRSSPSRRQTVFFPLFWYTRTPVYRFVSLVPLYFDLKKEYKRVVVIFPLYRFKTRYEADSSRYVYHTVFPLFWYKKTPVRTHISVLPFYRLKKETLQIEGINHYNKTAALFPFWYSRERLGADTHRFNMFFPFFISNHNGIKYRSLTLLGIYSKGYSTDRQTGHLVVAPLYWQFFSESGQNKVLFPLYWYKKVPNRDSGYFTSTTLFPLWYHRSTNGKNKGQFQFLFPFYHKYNNWNHYHSVSIIPFYSRGYSTDKKRKHWAATPLLWHLENPEQKSTFFIPVYWYKIRHYKGINPKVSHTLFPVYYSRRDNFYHSRVWFPLIWSYRFGTKHSLFVFPIWYHLHQPKRRQWVLFPLFWHQKRQLSDTVTDKNYYVFPVFRYQIRLTGGVTTHSFHSRTTLFPFWFARVKEDVDTQSFRLLWPLFHHQNNWRNYHALSVLGVFSKGESADRSFRHLICFPLFWKFQSARTDTRIAFPMVWYQKRDANNGWSFTQCRVLPNIYWKQQKDPNGNTRIKQFSIWPVYRFYKDSDLRSVRIFPLYASKNISGRQFRSITLFPFYRMVRSPDYRFDLVFPFFMHYHKNPGFEHKMQSVKAITPLYWQWVKKGRMLKLYAPLMLLTEMEGGERRVNVLGLIYRQQQHKYGNAIQILWPLIQFKRDTAGSYFHVAPLIWYKNTPVQKYLFLAPVYYKGLHKDVKRTDILWKLISKKQTPQKTTYGILFHALHLENYTNGDHVYRFMYLWVADIRKGGVIEKSIFPVYYKFQDTLGNKNFHAGFAFYAKTARRISNTNHFYREERVFWIVRFRSNYRYLKSAGIVNNRKELR